MTAIAISMLTSVIKSGSVAGNTSLRDRLPVSKAEEPRRRDVIVPGHNHHFAAQDTAEAGPIHQNNGEDDPVETDAKPHHENERENNRRKRHPDINEPADYPISGAAEISGNVREN